ncbi:uncharacterized protein ATC70_005154 [Mucor velutinosus]|uniref:Uncharacterized protein n=1 Tax=Mucor velutinosus TaxID=708070 RepID=A0AAN7D4L2_9FUNG|nr:hypothetical protein ATC70_005154 [Mucor velutinosus]
MGNSYSTQELKQKIQQDLKIDVAFPFFPLDRKTGSSACCVVDTEWIEKINSTADTDEPLVLKNPGYARNVATEGSLQKQSPTVNIYVSVLCKERAKGLSVYKPTSAASQQDAQQQQQETEERWPLINYIQSLLEGKGADQKIEMLHDVFNDYKEDDEQTDFVRTIQTMLWPSCKRFRKIASNNKTKQDDNGNTDDHIVLQQENQVLEPASDTSNSNLPNVFALIETDTAYYFLASYRGATLQDLITYNPGVLSSNLKKSFIIYQLLRVIASLHSRGIMHGGIKASNILVDENLWVQLAGIEFEPNPLDFDLKKWLYEQELSKMSREIPEEPLVIRWVKGTISNYSYLMALNHLAGRREGDPNFYPILPWITDFSGDSIADGWRNFRQTKFRINKGDEQLDFTFDGPVPHHITDILSDITYYVYQARKTPIPVLCQFVRSKYEPNEYPSSMQRLYQWTPDECIPEFYTDPTIFKSIHPDMPDIQIPTWAASPEDFIRKHSEALESDYVSRNLHHWIDLTFGNDLTGKGAIEAKNVALPLLAGQNSFMKHGIIQLFKDKHPQRGCNWNKTKKRDQGTMVSSPHIMPTTAHVETTEAAGLPTTTTAAIISTKSHRSNSVRTRQTVLSNNNSVDSATTGLLSHMANASPTGTTTAAASINTNRDRTPSIHSTASSIDTSRSLPSSITAAEPFISVLRTESIRMPLDTDELYFIDDLDHYEDMVAFAAKYNAMNQCDIVLNPIYPHPPHRFSIDPMDNTQGAKNKLPTAFAVGASHDMDCLGRVIQSIYTAGNAKVVDSDGEPSQAPASGYFEVGNGDVAYDIAPTGKIDVSPAVTSVISALTADAWQDRPTAKAILCASFPVMTVRSSRCSFPFPDTVPEMYDYLAAFHQAEWSRRLYLADKWIDRICDLEDEAFFLLLPSFSQLFTHVETRIGSISLFPKLAQRLGPERARRHLLKRIISMFESLRPNIPKVLFGNKIIYEFVKRLGISIFLQQLLPCYLEALAIHDPACSNKSVPLSTAAANVTSDATTNTETSKSTSDLAGDAMTHICTLLGPILTSKHIVRQLVKIILRDNHIRYSLIRTTVRIIGGFGSTFTSVQYAYLISLIDNYRKTVSSKDTQSICSILTLLQDLVPYMSNEALVTELRSGFISTLYQLLEPIHTADDVAAIKPEQLKLRLTLSIKTIDYLLMASQKLTLQEWESTIVSTLQKYFSGFTVNAEDGDDILTKSKPSSSLAAQKSYQMMYAYYKFSQIVSIEKLRRVIPTSDAIETMMFNHFSFHQHTLLQEPTASVSTSRIESSPTKKKSPLSISSTKSDTTSQQPQQQQTSSSSKFMSWMVPIKKSSQADNDASSISSKSSASKLIVDDLSIGVGKNSMQNIDISRLLGYATKDIQLSGLTHANCVDKKLDLTLTNTAASSTATVSNASIALSSATSTPSTLIHAEKLSDMTLIKPTDKESSKTKVPTSVLPWKTKWKPSPEDKKNWNRFLSTNSEEMSKSMQFSFNDLKLRGFAGHSAAIRTFAVNEPAKLFASGSKDKTVKIWSLNVHQGIEHWETSPYSESVVTYTGHKRATINDVHFMTTGGLNDIVASCDGHVHLWDLETGAGLHQFTGAKSSVVSFKPIFQSRHLVGGTVDGNISFFDAHNHIPLHTWKSSTMLSGVIRVIAVNPAETLVAVGFSTGAISLLESRTGTLVASWKGGDTEITSIKFYTDDLLLSCAPADHLICCWNVNRLALVKTISAPQDVTSLDIFKDEILTINSNNSVSFIPINDDFQAYSSKFKPSIMKSAVSSFNIIPTDQLLLFGCAEGEIFLYA